MFPNEWYVRKSLTYLRNLPSSSSICAKLSNWSLRYHSSDSSGNSRYITRRIPSLTLSSRTPYHPSSSGSGQRKSRPFVRWSWLVAFLFMAMVTIPTTTGGTVYGYLRLRRGSFGLCISSSPKSPANGTSVTSSRASHRSKSCSEGFANRLKIF